MGGTEDAVEGDIGGGGELHVWGQDLEGGSGREAFSPHPTQSSQCPIMTGAQRRNWQGHDGGCRLTQAHSRGGPKILSDPAPSHRHMETADPPPRGVLGSLRSLQKSSRAGTHVLQHLPDSGCICIFVHFLLLPRQE